MAKRTLKIIPESFPLLRPFRISRGVKTAAELVRVEIGQDGAKGQGECCPYPRYGESVDSVMSQIKSVWHKGLNRQDLQNSLPPGAARNALDCALWDLEAKTEGLDFPETFQTMRTVGIDTPDEMVKVALAYPKGSILKVKLDKKDALTPLVAISNAAPESAIVVDANEAWDGGFLKQIMPDLKALGVILIEQPLPAGEDQGLGTFDHLIPICADESAHTRADLAGLKGRYDVINIKLDKTGGLTEAIALCQEAKAGGFKIMLGCMASTSLSIAPISHLCSHADFIDLDGPLLLKSDRKGGLVEVTGTPYVKMTANWGRP